MVDNDEAADVAGRIQDVANTSLPRTIVRRSIADEEVSAERRIDGESCNRSIPCLIRVMVGVCYDEFNA